MKLKVYLKEKLISIILICVFTTLSSLFQIAFKVNYSCILAELVMIFILSIIAFSLDYYKRYSFYSDFLSKLDGLDQKYLITEMVSEPEFAEGKILYESLYEIDKSMKEKINRINNAGEEFRDYIEMWIHEIKLPLSAMTLMNYNATATAERKNALLKKIEYYVEQILFMARADAAEKDYLLKKVTLEEIINKALVANKDLLIENHISIEKQNLQMTITTDAKWMEFIIGQLIGNSVKYMKEGEKKIVFSAQKESEDKIIFTLEDNGMGIANEDISRIFEKSFTGKNGHSNSKSTGMGLYICRKLCDKMGHRIYAESEYGKYTKLHIEFGTNKYINFE